jgi:hypothetical protein
MPALDTLSQEAAAHDGYLGVVVPQPMHGELVVSILGNNSASVAGSNPTRVLIPCVCPAFPQTDRRKPFKRHTR